MDGIAVPDAFGIGSFSNAGRDVVDIDALKRVEIVRGAASSLYGSDALAGVVKYASKDPLDFLTPAWPHRDRRSLARGSGHAEARPTHRTDKRKRRVERPNGAYERGESAKLRKALTRLSSPHLLGN